MQLKKYFRKIVASLVLIMFISTAFIGNFNITYGKTNKVYVSDTEVGSIDVEQAVTDSTILGGLARMAYALTGYIESIVGYLVQVLTGVKVFPWADRVVFNTMPLLDINFFSPSAGSMFADPNGVTTNLGRIIGNIYYTIFTLAVTFFGVVVGVMALRLAISSIASEKARYKQAITNWLLALILLFTSHYLISFIFFVNEKMVEVASSVVTSQEGLEFNIDVANMTREQMDEVCKIILAEALAGESYDQTFHDESSLVFYDPSELNYRYYSETDYKRVTYGTNIFSIKFGDEGSTDHWGIRQYDDYNDWSEKDGKKWGDTGTNHEAWLKCIMALIADSSYKVNLNIGSNEEHTYILFMDAAYILNLIKFHGLLEGGVSEFEFRNGMRNLAAHINNNDGAGKMYDFNQSVTLTPGTEWRDEFNRREEHFDRLWTHVEKYYLGNRGKYKEQAFTGMAEFFKSAVTAISIYKDEDGEKKLNTFNPIPAILYSVFVIQSIMYFISYIKRFFYIIVLVLFAPLVIVYDFLMKSSMG